MLEERAPTPGYIEISDIIARAGDFFTLLGNQFAPIQNVNHTIKVELSSHPLSTTVIDPVNAGGYFRLTVSLPMSTSPGIHELKATILPEHLSKSIKIAVCGLDGKGCEPRIGILSSKVKHTVTTFFEPTKFASGEEVRLIGDGFKVPANDGFSPVATAEIWVDRTCVNAGPRCVERGIQVATTDVYYYRGAGNFGVFVTIPTSLDAHGLHRLQAFVNGQVAEILFRVDTT